MKHVTILTLLSAILLTLAHSDPPARAAQLAVSEPDWTPIECPMEIPARYQVECGVVAVPEDHSSPDGPSIRLAVAVVHSSGETKAPDPLLFINGGPGARTLDSMSLWLETFSLGPLLTKRDIIFFDQRGTGYSQPALVCSESPSANPLLILQDTASLTTCRDRLIADGINLGAYTSTPNAADIAALRKALGYERWNLYGVSYGARIALTVLRDHPEGVRSVVLDGITPIEANLLLEDPVYAQRALQHLFAACRADPVCRTAYPDVEHVYDELVGDLAKNPTALETTNGKTGKIRVEEFNGAMLNGTVLSMLGSPEAAGIPSLIYDLRAGNYGPIVADLEAAWETEEAISGKPAPVGAQLAMICGEEAPFVTPAAMEQMLADYPPEAHSRAAIGATFYLACQTWGVGPADPLEDAPVSSDTPVLVLAGEYDVVRPLAEARRAAEPLAHSTVIEFPGAGHTVALAGTCPLNVMAQFLDDPTTAPDTRCTASMDTPHFFITITLTRPFARAAAVIAGVTGLVVAAYAGIGLGRMTVRRRIPWRITLRRVGWLPLAIVALATVALYCVWPVGGLDHLSTRSLAQVAVMLGPLAVAIQAAFFFASEDDPAREVVLACPRPFHWLPIERTAVALLGQTLIAVVSTAIGMWGLGEQLPIAPSLAVVGWLSSALLLSGLAAFSSVRSRQAMMGVLLALLTWLVMGFAGSNQLDEVLLPPVPLGFHFAWPRPLDVIQPFLWLVHPFLRPGCVSSGDFLLNRIIVGGLGLALMALAARRLADAERVLLGTAARRSRVGSKTRSRQKRSLVRAPKSVAAFAQIRDVRLIQFWTIVRYELLMSWRRGSLRAILISILLLPQLFHIITHLFGAMLDEATIASLADRPEVLLLAGTNAALVSNATTIIMIVVMLPLMVAEIIPLDRQHRVREVIDALPVSRGLYLAGKLLSVWPVILVGLGVGGVLNGLVSWVLNGPFQIGTLVLFWLTGLIPLALFGSQMGVMFAAGQPNRRRAALTGLLAFVATLAASFALPVNQFLAAGTFQLVLNMAAIDDPRVSAALPSFPDMLSWGVWLRIASVVLVMITVWLCTARLLQRRQVAHSQEALQ